MRSWIISGGYWAGTALCPHMALGQQIQKSPDYRGLGRRSSHLKSWGATGFGTLRPHFPLCSWPNRRELCSADSSQAHVQGALRRKLQPAAQEEALDLRCWCIRRCEAIGEGHGQTLLMCETLKAYFHIFGGFTHMLGKADFCTQVKSDYGGFLRCLRDVLALRWVLFWMALRGGRRGNRRKVKP